MAGGEEGAQRLDALLGRGDGLAWRPHGVTDRHLRVPQRVEDRLRERRWGGAAHEQHHVDVRVEAQPSPAGPPDRDEGRSRRLPEELDEGFVHRVAQRQTDLGPARARPLGEQSVPGLEKGNERACDPLVP